MGDRRIRAANIFLVVLFVLSAGTGAGVWAVAWRYSREIQASASQIAQLEQTIGSLSVKEQKIQLLANRLKSAQSIMTSRADFEKKLDQIAAALPQGVSILSAELEKSGKSATLRLESATYGGFRDVIVALQNGSFPKVDVKGFSRSHAGTYSIELVLFLS